MSHTMQIMRTMQTTQKYKTVLRRTISVKPCRRTCNTCRNDRFNH
uniref:Uncharacterized protein n=1 Tax=Anguilla anguilla TaxID=7936 RepID=A0A0E9U6E3_ANGAN